MAAGCVGGLIFTTLASLRVLPFPFNVVFEIAQVACAVYFHQTLASHDLLQFLHGLWQFVMFFVHAIASVLKLLEALKKESRWPYRNKNRDMIKCWWINLQYSLVQPRWNWFSEITAAAAFACIQWRQRTNFIPPLLYRLWKMNEKERNLLLLWHDLPVALLSKKKF